eukprot:TRINITY_DN63986_c0_g1_i1.p3 TRINITY_DN63986_c0_g1~~TRINITY_DN63986_c0_g1_i1.p3  ORF type:complete len:116 (-),score=2.24 TRINITY_DN63986_c0_g1_i1:133-432(-)
MAGTSSTSTVASRMKPSGDTVSEVLLLTVRGSAMPRGPSSLDVAPSLVATMPANSGSGDRTAENPAALAARAAAAAAALPFVAVVVVEETSAKYVKGLL